MYQKIYRRLVWVGNSHAAFLAFPKSAIREIGFQLHLVQFGLEPSDHKPMKSIGRGVKELRVRTADGQFRVIYILEEPEFVHVLHCFVKKTQKTPVHEVELARKRLKEIRHGH